MDVSLSLTGSVFPIQRKAFLSREDVIVILADNPPKGPKLSLVIVKFLPLDHFQGSKAPDQYWSSQRYSAKRMVS